MIKLSLKPVSMAGAERDRLISEGRVLAELDHPNLARVVDPDFYGDRPFLVMEYVRGRNLRQHLHYRRLSPREAARLIAKIARALAPAHALGIIHQDIKPESIILGETGRPRIVDFGLARLRHAWADNSGDPNTICGTTPYMAPEQARGDTAQVDAHVDIFALGSVLYELLVGMALFAGSDSRESLERARRCE